MQYLEPTQNVVEMNKLKLNTLGNTKINNIFIFRSTDLYLTALAQKKKK